MCYILKEDYYYYTEEQGSYLFAIQFTLYKGTAALGFFPSISVIAKYLHVL